MHVFRGNKTISSTSTHASLRAATAERTMCTRDVDKDLPGSGDLSSLLGAGADAPQQR